MADLAIGYLMDQLSTVALMMHVQQAVQQTFHINGIQEEKHTPKRLEYADYDHSPLLPALFSGNAGNFSTQCILEDGIQGYVSVNAVRFPPSMPLPDDLLEPSLARREVLLAAGLQMGQ